MTTKYSEEAFEMNFNAKKVSFPAPKSRNVNMMPFVMGVYATLPHDLHDYIPLIEECDSFSKYKKDKTLYLTIEEKFLNVGEYGRRPGIHTDATCKHSWGGGPSPWGGNGGIYMASNDGLCRIWLNSIGWRDVDKHGGLLRKPIDEPNNCKPNTLYQISDTTPHESLPAKTAHMRQFFRLVGPDIGVWYAKHSTPNPFGVQPNAIIEEESKF